MKKYLRLWGCLLLCLVLPASSFSQAKLSPAILAHIDDIFSSLENVPGCGLGIFSHGEVVFQKGYGLANLDYKIPISSQTVFETASLSKHFTAACIILLENQGKLSLDDPIQKYLPEMPVYPEGEIRIEHLLKQTSGLREYLKLLYARGQDWYGNKDNEQVYKLLIQQQGINFVPGSRYAYSNTNYMLLSEIVARVSGSSIGVFANEHLFAPLGMNDSFYYEDKSRIIPNRATGYEAEGGNYIQDHSFNSTVTGDGGVYTTIEDFFKWSENFKSNKIGNETFWEKMLTKGRLNNGEETRYAAGLFLDDYQGLASIGHDGEWAGFRSLFFKFPDQDISFVLLSNNAQVNVWRYLGALVELLMEEDIAQAQRTERPSIQRETVSLTSSELANFSGDYFNPLNGYSRNLYVLNDTLIYRRPTGAENKLLPISDHEFNFMGLPHVLLTFPQKHEKTEKLSIKIANQAEIVLQKYKPHSYTNKGLKQYVGAYYSKELDATYHIAQKDAGRLAIYIGDDELLSLEPVMEHVFNEEHFGYLKFGYGDKGSIDHFTINDELARDILFTKIKDA